MTTTLETPTAELRFLLRDAQQVLQQLWRVETFAAQKINSINGEWRDVPVMTEPGS